jgi:tRNA threonylcarbamoyladenosine biosynthesis protein TsaE
LQPGDLLCLRGDLGAGKTALVQGLAEGLEAAEPATSPGFTLIHRHQGRIPLYHLDLYRLGPADLPDIGVEEVLGGEAVVVVEWAERLPCGLSGDGLDIEMQFDAVDEQTRRFRLSPRGFRGKQILRALEERLHARACH